MSSKVKIRDLENIHRCYAEFFSVLFSFKTLTEVQLEAHNRSKKFFFWHTETTSTDVWEYYLLFERNRKVIGCGEIKVLFIFLRSLDFFVDGKLFDLMDIHRLNFTNIDYVSSLCWWKLMRFLWFYFLFPPMIELLILFFNYFLFHFQVSWRLFYWFLQLNSRHSQNEQ